MGPLAAGSTGRGKRPEGSRKVPEGWGVRGRGMSRAAHRQIFLGSGYADGREATVSVTPGQREVRAS